VSRRQAAGKAFGAPGYEALDVHKLVVKAKHDLIVGLEF